MTYKELPKGIHFWKAVEGRPIMKLTFKFEQEGYVKFFLIFMVFEDEPNVLYYHREPAGSSDEYYYLPKEKIVSLLPENTENKIRYFYSFEGLIIILKGDIGTFLTPELLEYFDISVIAPSKIGLFPKFLSARLKDAISYLNKYAWKI